MVPSRHINSNHVVKGEDLAAVIELPSAEKENSDFTL